MTIRKVLLTGAAAATLLLSAPDLRAQDASGDNWSGWYAGGHAGYRWADADLEAPSYMFGINTYPARNDSFGPDGGIAGLQLGYNRQRQASSWLWGVEGDFSWGWGDDKLTTNGQAPLTPGEIGPPSLAFTQTSELEADWQATLRGRLGKVKGSTLYYATAGIAWLHADWSDSMTFPAFPGISFSSSDSVLFTGFTVGGGIERELRDPRWRVRLEYLYEHFGDETVPHGPTTPRQAAEIDLDAHKLRFAISRKFGGRAAPAALK